MLLWVQKTIVMSATKMSAIAKSINIRCGAVILVGMAVRNKVMLQHGHITMQTGRSEVYFKVYRFIKSERKISRGKIPSKCQMFRHCSDWGD